MDRVRSPLHPREEGGPEAMCLLRGAATRLPPVEVVGIRPHRGAVVTHPRHHPVGVMANTSNPRTRG